MEMILYIIQPLALGGCPNENFNLIVYREFHKSIEGAFKQVEFEFSVKKRIGEDVKFGKDQGETL